MQDIIKTALKEAMQKALNSTPQTKKQSKHLDILDVEPIKLLEFMKNNNVPDDACFSGIDNGYDGWGQIVIEWQIDVPTTDKDKLEYQKRAFNNSSTVAKALIANGYKRQGVISSAFKQFADTSPYDMYMNGDFDRLEKYYSLSWTKA